VVKPALVFALGLATIVGGGPTSQSPRAPRLETLAGVFSDGPGAVRDTNGDGLPDEVVARVVVPAEPTADDVEAAANIAARLGWETTAITLPIVGRDDGPAPDATTLPILVGRGNRYIRRLADQGALDLASLGPGQGLVSLVTLAPGGATGVAVVGGDDAGTLSAAVELSARVPRLWTMTGITLGAIEQQVARLLQAHGVAAPVVHVVALTVDTERRGIAVVRVDAHLAAADVPRAVAALQGVDTAHRRGQGAQTLNFAEAARTRVDLLVDGRVAGTVAVARTGMNVRTLTPPVDPDEFAPEPNALGVVEPRLAPARTFDLSNTYTLDGWYGDAYQDLIPDRTDTSIVVGGPEDSLGAAHIAARLGLDTTGIALPITKRDDRVKEPGNEPSPILVGRSNTLVQQLVKIGKTRLDDLQPGEGVIQIVPRAFGNATATVVAGADAAGTMAASQYLAGRVPYLWQVRRGAPAYEDVVAEATKFLSARSAAGQAAQALQQLRSTLDDLKGKTIESFDAKLFLEHGDRALDAQLTTQVKAALGAAASVSVTSAGVTDPDPVFEDTIQIPWEVDEFWAKIRSDLLPKVGAGADVDVEARLSEPLKLRQELAARVREELIKAGAVNPRVRILCAYKQGYSWLTEEVIPALRGRGARAIRLRIAAFKPDLSKKYKFYTVPTRWLHELYPVDEILQRDLGISTSAFTMELVDGPKDVYALDALDASGRVVHRATFSPKVVEREYLEQFPGWSRVEVTTGWLTATVGGRTAVDTRIETDPERFWDYYQGKVLPRVYDHVMKTTGGKPTADKQPFHRDLDIEVWMSEPDDRIGVDEEQISSLEALHEDLYFVTLDFFAAMGRTLTKARLNAPGKVFPVVHPSRPGRPGEARIRYLGNAAAKPRLDISYRETGADQPTKISRDLARIETTAPMATRAVVRDDGVREVELQVEAKDDREAARAVDALDGLVALQAAGLYRTTLSFDHVDRVAVSVLLKDARARRVVRHTGVSMPSNVRAAQAPPAGRLVTWDHVMGPDESEDIVRKLGACPEARSYKVGQSYRGRDISAIELTLPTPSELTSITKYTAFKPTILLIGRQHANEVSSTSHILRLAELIATDPAYREILKKVNVVVCPVVNPDGAEMAYELQKLTPTNMLHAGRYSALGMDVTSRAVGLLPEAEVEGKLWRTWLPDIYLNPHGYPSHEWVQPFSGYVPPGFRAYWTSRGWYTMVSGLRDPRYPEHADAVAALRDAIAEAINSNPDVRAMDLRHQDRYRRWAYDFGPHVYGVEVYKDTMIYYSDPETGEPRGARRAAVPPAGAGGRPAVIGAWPQVTFMSGMTEAPDETAQDGWLSLVTKAGFSFLMAHIKYLEDGDSHIIRIEEGGPRDGAVLTMLRMRPVTPRKTAVLTPPAAPPR
jgi:hypothetical protein